MLYLPYSLLIGCGPMQVSHIPRLVIVYYHGMSGKDLEHCMTTSPVMPFLSSAC